MDNDSDLIIQKLKKRGVSLNNPISLSYALIHACINNELDIVDFCLSSPELKVHANIHIDEDEPLRNACKFGHVEIVKYLLSSPKITEHACAQHPDNIFLYTAYDNNRLDVIKYLLGSPELLKKPNVHINKDETFIHCTMYKLYDIVNYLIFDLNIEKTEHINNYLIDHPDEKVNSWFNLRELNKNLTASLESASNAQLKKPKL